MLDKSDDSQEEDIPPPPNYTPCIQLVRVHARLCEFINNSLSLSKTMSSAATVLEQKLYDLKNEIDLPKLYITLPENYKAEWKCFLKKTIVHCRAIEKIPNPFSEAEALIKKANFSLEDYAESIHSIHSCAVNDNYNQALRTRAGHCLWLTLFFTVLAKSPLEIQNLHELITAFQRITRLGLFTEAGIAGIKTLTNIAEDHRSSQILNTVTIQLLQLDSKSKLVGQVANLMQEAMDTFMKEMLPSMSLLESLSRFLALEPLIYTFIESITGQLLMNEDYLEKGELAKVLKF